MITSDTVDGWVRLGSKRIDDQLAAVERGTSLALGPRVGADDGGDANFRTRGGGVPQSRGVVPRRGRHALAVGAEDRALHPAGMAFEDGGLFAGVGVPQPRGFVVRRGHHALAIGAEGWADMNEKLRHLPTLNGTKVRPCHVAVICRFGSICRVRYNRAATSTRGFPWPMKS
jgi:hypothetical protein